MLAEHRTERSRRELSARIVAVAIVRAEIEQAVEEEVGIRAEAQVEQFALA